MRIHNTHDVFNHVFVLQFQDALYERALQCLPGSYKLWYSYLSTKTKRVRLRYVTGLFVFALLLAVNSRSYTQYGTLF